MIFCQSRHLKKGTRWKTSHNHSSYFPSFRSKTFSVDCSWSRRLSTNSMLAPVYSLRTHSVIFWNVECWHLVIVFTSKCSSVIHSCITTLWDSGVKGIRMLKVPCVQREWTLIDCPSAQYLCGSRMYLHTEICQFLSGFHHVKGELFLHKLVLSCGSPLAPGTLISCCP